MDIKQMHGQTFGAWTVLEFDSCIPGCHAKWICKCNCGTIRKVDGAALRAGKSKSCGCLSIQVNSDRLRTHGKRHYAEYGIWCHIKERCTNINSLAYPTYGGRGIGICDRWLDFANFYADMGPRPSDRHSVDRIDNEKGYEPSNCRWATSKEQNRNRRNNRLFVVDGINAPLAEHCERRGLKYKTVHRRLACGAPIEVALSAGRMRW